MKRKYTRSDEQRADIVGEFIHDACYTVLIAGSIIAGIAGFYDIFKKSAEQKIEKDNLRNNYSRIENIAR